MTPASAPDHIEAHELTTHHGDTTGVHTLSFAIAPGTVTGFLGIGDRLPVHPAGGLLVGKRDPADGFSLPA